MKATPCFVNYCFHPGFNSHLAPSDNSPQALNAKSFANTMADLNDFLRTQMLSSQNGYEAHTNKSRIPATACRVGDQVFLSTKNIRTASWSRKLDWKRIGPFAIKTVVSPYAYELILPPTVKLHSVFHVSLLDSAPSTPVPGQREQPPPPVIIDDNEEYVIEEILDS